MKDLIQEYHKAMSHYTYYSMKLNRINKLTQEDRAYLLERMRDWEAAIEIAQAKIKLFQENAKDKL